MSTPRRVLAFTVIALTSCDGSLPPGAADSGAPDAPLLADLGQAIARATCANVDRCCSAADRARVIGVGENFSMCEATLGSFYGRQFGPTAALVAMGRTTFDVQRMTRCLETYLGAECTAPGLAAAAACREVFQGAVPNGGACESNLECVSHSCTAGAGGTRVCGARKRDGEPCARSGECESGVCRTSFLSDICTSRPAEVAGCGGDGFWLSF